MRRLTYLVLAATPLLACEDESFVPLAPPQVDAAPVLWMWVGPRDEAPSCIDGQAPKWEGWMLEAPERQPETCEGCTCGQAACVLPSKVTTSAASCPRGGSSVDVSVHVDAGEAWDGTCAALPSPVEPDERASVVYEPPALSPCTPSGTPEPPPLPARFVRVCAGNTAQEPPGFIACMQATREGRCDLALTRLEFFEELIDHRACPPCACDPPAGGTCLADVVLHGDSTCSDRVDAALSLGLGDVRCADVRSPLALGAMSAVLVDAEPGACSPSVPVVTGAVERREPRVVCAFSDI
ncbi:hypothetical protein WMF11_44620 [Sorangium sp. So ce295]|uniref:hypothetical protein n=1 Tax=Sorangium sp. So ce295 TaxID=3133295 RepID=UPI003F6387CF